MFDRQPQRITYRIGGCLPPNAPTYVVRQADRDLERYLQAGEFCYVLTSRQMGKSSLKLRTLQRLVAQDVACVNIDLTGVGSAGIIAAQWFYSIADELATEFELEAELAPFWDSHSHLSDIKKLGKFIETVILDRIDRQIVIFVDEIDKVISLGSFTDDFFGLIRNCAERRATTAKYQRLSFVLLGVAAPTDLIKDKQRTPLNIGRAIELDGFQLTDDLSPLMQGLAEVSADPHQTIVEVLSWTGGQPFLTQKLCQLIVEFPLLSIRDIVDTKIIDNWKDRDNPVHLRTIEARLLANREISSYLLQQYRSIITSKYSLDANHSLEQQSLKLSGLVVERDGKLQVYNPIYARVFDRDWVDRELANICPYTSALTAWLDNGRPDPLLLRGDALDEAISWKELQWQYHQSIGIDGAAFIDRSQVKRTDRKLTKIKHRISNLVKILLVLIIAGLVLLFALIWFDRSLNISGQINQLDRASNQIVSQYEFAPIDALKAAIINASKSQNIQLPSPSNSVTASKLALQKLVDNIQEVDEIDTHQQGINTVNFCSDNLIIAAGSDGTINVWNRQKVQEEPIEIIALKSEVKINSIRQSSPNCEDIFVTGSSDGKVALWEWNVNRPTKLEHPISETVAHAHNALDNELGVQNVLVTEDKRYIFSTGKTDGVLKKWSIDRQNHQLTLVWSNLAHKNGVISLNLNSQKNLIATTGKDGNGRIWDLEGHLITVLTGHIGDVNSINFNPKISQDSSLYKIATGGNDGTVRLWSDDGKYLNSINAHIGEVRTVRFSPDGKLLATASANDPTTSNGSSIRIWNLEDRKLVAEFKGHQGAIDSMRFNPNFNRENGDFRQLATSGQEDSIIRIWKIPEITLSNKHQEKINSVRFDPNDSKYFVTAGDDGKIAWWSQRPGSLPDRIDSVDRINKDDKPAKFKTIRIYSAPESGPKSIVVGDTSGKIELLKIHDNKIEAIGYFNSEQGDIQSIDWYYDNTSDRYLLATAGTVGDNIRIWEIEIAENKLVNSRLIYSRDLKYLNKKYSNISLRFSKDGKNIAVGAEKGRVALIKNLNSILTKEPTVHTLVVNSDKAANSKVAVGFSGDDRSFTVVSKEGKIWQLNLDAKIIAGPIETYQAGTENIAISQDGQIATGGSGAALRLWDLQGHQIADFRGYWGTIRSINFSKDGKYLLAGGDDGIPRVWQIDRDLPTLIDRGCQWLAQGYLKSHRAGEAVGEKIDSSLMGVCRQ